MRRVLLVFVLLILLMTACAADPAPTGPAATEEPSTVDEQPTSTEVPADVPVDLTPAQRAAIEALAEKLSLAADQIELVATEAVEWPDGCLGIVRPGVTCTQAIVPGFQIILEADGQEYEYHTNEDGSLVLLAEGMQDLSAVEQELIKQLAANLGLQESDISVLSTEQVEFADACLDVAMEGVLCAQVITPGHIIVLEANGMQFEYHTSADGSRVQPASIALTWKREGGIVGFCDVLTVFRSGEVYASRCSSQAEGNMGTFADLLSAEEQQKFMDWMAQFGEVELDASDPKGVADRMVILLNLSGVGDQQPTEAEQETLLTFAQELYQELTQ